MSDYISILAAALIFAAGFLAGVHYCRKELDKARQFARQASSRMDEVLAKWEKIHKELDRRLGK